MRLLYCGDVVGKAGRRAVETHLPPLRERLKLDCIVVNGENAAHGFGITKGICESFFDLGVDVIVTGNHVWDQRETIGYIGSESRLLRPLNVQAGTPGMGAIQITTGSGRKVLVIQVMGRLFMSPVDDPFAAVERELTKYRLGASVDAIIVDVHAEATSEKMGMGQHLDGRVSLVVGSHTHVPSADAQVLPKGTAYQTDAGMCGDYDSVIGMVKEGAIARFLKHTPSGRLEPAGGEATLCAIFAETDDRTGLATRVEPVRVGGRLMQWVPTLD
ncbi:TIGR00282 family metallophosphoesterase [Magnetospira sp. QH-2]|uniref:TIGR00282 family metallophosphoesterase n=1 Tax=Magnetospira sp. (strain QH-2) TaxID=1288970 RepID=UPI0003E815C0|nr:TIGR00282 family metallophosphoesterase [Magnetospira sp. QH-2]CCQ73305.1 Putative metallo-phosphoesterase [Magnetospira sp. QH-2]